jgi:hypothetical protein
MLFGVGIPACVLFAGSVVFFLRGRTVSSLLQLFGAGCLVVVSTYLCLRRTSLVSLDAVGTNRIALVITSILAALFLVSRYFP